jgi:phosphoribosylglycinamide formyltransferase-1
MSLPSGSRRRVGILISGRGSNMAALIEAARAPDYPAEIAIVLSNQENAPGLARAQAAGIPARAIPHRPFGRDREAHERALLAALEEARVEIVCLAGYMRKLTPFLVGAFRGRMLNIHPSLLPAFPGLDTHARALAAGVKIHGCTVHLVTETLDEGPILAQAALAVRPEDTPESLAARVLALEHRIYPAALAAHIEGRAGAPPDAAAALLNPLPCPAHPS